MKKAHDLRDLAVEELENQVREKSEELMNLRIQLNMRQLDNPLRVRQTRREIAVLQDRHQPEERRPVGAESGARRQRRPEPGRWNDGQHRT